MTISPLAADAVSLQTVPAQDPDRPPQCRLTIDARVAPQPVQGAVLEAAFRCDGRTLVVLSDDVPYEDALRIHLLDEDLVLIDSASLGWMYSTGRFELLGLVQPSTVRFRFFGDTEWSVQLLRSAGARVPFFSEPRGVQRKLGFVRHFRIDGNPKPQDAG